MRPLPSGLRLPLAALVLALTAAACSSSGTNIESLKDELSSQEGRAQAEKVRPPPVANPGLTARVGQILNTNSRTWNKLVSAATDRGVAVLFVQPGGPSEGTGIAVGDVITRVDGQAVTNADRAVVLLRSRPGQRRTVSVTKPDGTQANVSVTARVPGPVDLTSIYTDMIAKDPDNAMLYYLRANQEQVDASGAIADADKAIELMPGFVEAIALRAGKLWNRAARQQNPNAADVDRDRALQDWGLAIRLDPQNARALASRAVALAGTGAAASARRDAQKAVSIDPNLAIAQNALAVSNVNLGKFAEAALPARRAVELDPFNVAYYKVLALVFMRLGRTQDARKTVDAIYDLIPSEDAATREDLLRVVDARPGGGR